jgi:hypothetical protein
MRRQDLIGFNNECWMIHMIPLLVDWIGLDQRNLQMMAGCA